MALHAQLDDLLERFLPMVQHFHSQGMFSPHAVTLGSDGELTGRAVTTDGTAQVSLEHTIANFESNFREMAAAGTIHASGIFYHSPGIDTSTGTLSLPPAHTVDECRSLVGMIEHICGQSLYIQISYSGEGEAIVYASGKLIEKPAKVFLPQPGPAAKPWWKIW